MEMQQKVIKKNFQRVPDFLELQKSITYKAENPRRYINFIYIKFAL